MAGRSESLPNNHDQFASFTHKVIAEFDSKKVKRDYERLKKAENNPTFLWIAADTALVRAEIRKDSVQDYFRGEVFRLTDVLASNK